MNHDMKEILFTKEQIQHRVQELGQAITNDYQEKIPILVGILKGGVPFMADLIREINLPLEYDLMAVSSYGASTKSSGTVKIIKDLDVSIEGREVIIVEDIVDTGLTLHYLLENLKSRRPNSLKIATMLDKPSQRKMTIQPDYNGFEIPNVFVVGYGLDYAEKYRNLPYIGVLKEEVYLGKSRES
jgi:hypoxanthine phosphoribosyltransferase